MAETHPRATLPGSIHRKGKRWWWKVQLPGEDKAKDRPLRAEGAKQATQNKTEAEATALGLWESAIRNDALGQAKSLAEDRVARLKTQFLEQVAKFRDLVAKAGAQTKAEAQSRAKVEAKLRQVLHYPAGQGRALTDRPGTGGCECCGRSGIPVAQLYRLDSGQRLCPECLRQFRFDARRSEPVTVRYLASVG